MKPSAITGATLAAWLTIGSALVQASSTPDVTLEQLIPESDLIVVGTIESVRETDAEWIMGTRLHVATVAVDAIALGRAEHVYILFAPGLSDEPVLDRAVTYVLFLVRASEADAHAVGVSRTELFRVTRFDRGALVVRNGVVDAYAVLGEGEEDVEELLGRMCVIARSQRRAYGASCPHTAHSR